MLSRSTRFAVRTLSGVSAPAPRQSETESAIVNNAIETGRMEVFLGGGNEGSRVMLLRDGRLQIHRRGVVDDILDVLALGKHGALVAVHREVPDLPRCEAPDVKSGLEVLAGAVGSLAVVLRPGQTLLSPPEQFRASFGFGPLQESLKETLLQRSEAKACAELLRGTQQRLSRSQYDCEAADRAGKYLKAGLDVWGFAAWQIRHFPMDGYKGAMLPQCKDIKDIVDHSSSVDLQSTVAQQHHP